MKQGNIIRMPGRNNLSEPFLLKPSKKKIQLIRKVSAGTAMNVSEMPEEYWQDRRFTLDELLIKDPAKAAIYIVYGDSMHPTLTNGDLILIDTSQVQELSSCPERLTDKIIVALHNGDENVKRFKWINGQVYLCSDNPKFEIIPVKEGDSFQVLGVVTRVIKEL